MLMLQFDIIKFIAQKLLQGMLREVGSICYSHKGCKGCNQCKGFFHSESAGRLVTAQVAHRHSRNHAICSRTKLLPVELSLVDSLCGGLWVQLQPQQQTSVIVHMKGMSLTASRAPTALSQADQKAPVPGRGANSLEYEHLLLCLRPALIANRVSACEVNITSTRWKTMIWTAKSTFQDLIAVSNLLLPM